MHGFEVWMRNEQKSKSKVYTSRSSSDLSCFFSFDLAAENTAVRQPLCTCTVKPLVFYGDRWKPKSINYERLHVCIKRNYVAY